MRQKWFARAAIGRPWLVVPVTWQGWLLSAAVVAVVVMLQGLEGPILKTVLSIGALAGFYLMARFNFGPDRR